MQNDFNDLLELETRSTRALWNSEVLQHLPAGETVVIKRLSWDGDNRYSLKVEVHVQTKRSRAGIPRGIGLATEHPGVTLLFLYLVHRGHTEKQAILATRDVFPKAPSAERVGRYRRVKRSLVIALMGKSQGPVFEAFKPLVTERDRSPEETMITLKMARATIGTKTLAEYDRAVEEIAKRQGLAEWCSKRRLSRGGSTRRIPFSVGRSDRGRFFHHEK